MKQLEQIAELLIRYYPPIGNIEHKYKTKVTAIGLLKTANLVNPQFFNPYYDRLKSYKSLIVDLLENFQLSSRASQEIFTDIIYNVVNDVNLPPEEAYKSPHVISLLTLVSPKLADMDTRSLYQYSKKFIVNSGKENACEKMAKYIIDNYISESRKYDDIATLIVKKCLTEIKQEDVAKKLAESIFNFFVYGYFDHKRVQLVYEIASKHKNKVERHEPFFKLQILSRFIISKVQSFKTTVNFFGPRIDNYDEIKDFFKKKQNISVMFF
jgi:hypothetical protein